ncbi:hypothetical protein HanRHA438_Chr01g0016601 [Helianthus annuus]|nr:hypothetical protein HanIR_Chr01g0018021 [Helianthus annuus]KAJ0947565.1 hypothetical protein HanRHA438_Chr01g0016601 [Helianthus annuus]
MFSLIKQIRRYLALYDKLNPLIEIRNRECVVLPPVSNKEAIPREATFKTIFPFDRSDVDNVFQKKFLPVPPYP